MSISRKADYALRAMVELASAGKEYVSTRELARLSQVPYTFMAKIVGELLSHRLVEIRRGREGGVKISGDAANISLLQVLEAVSGPFKLNTCTADPHSCSRADFCPVHKTLVKAQRELESTLSAGLKSMTEQSSQ